MATYKSSYTGPQIDAAVGHAVNMDVNPTAGHTDRVVSSGGVKSALNDISSLLFGNKGAAYNLDLDDVNCVITDVNGWSSSIANMPPSTPQGYHTLFTVWDDANHIGNTAYQRIQVFIANNGKVSRRQYVNGAWSAWSSAD